MKNSEFWKRFKKNLPAVLSLYLFIFVILVSIGAQFVANDQPLFVSYKGSWYFPAFKKYLPKDFGKEGFVVDYYALEGETKNEALFLWPPIVQRPYEQNLNFEELPAPPGSSSLVSKSETFNGRKVFHLFGTDTGGRDLLTRLIYGSRTSLVMATSITLLSLIFGVILGAFMSYKGGLTDLIMGRLLETIGYFPVIFLMIILVAFIENPSLTLIVFIFSILGLSPFAFYMRGQVLKVRKLTFIEAAKALGQTDLKIMFSHILPNAISPILVLVPFAITSNITFLATIDFLGFGVQPPTASLGVLLRSGYDDVANRWWLVVASAVVLVLILLLVNFIGEGVRDGFDPHSAINKKKIRELEQIEEEEAEVIESDAIKHRQWM